MHIHMKTLAHILHARLFDIYERTYKRFRFARLSNRPIRCAAHTHRHQIQIDT